MKQADRLAELLAFVRLYMAVDAALAVGAQQPLTSDPLMNAYDFRPREGALRPSKAMAFKAIRALGYLPDRGQDRGVFLTYHLCQLEAYLNYYTRECFPEYKIAQLVCAFKHYSDLKEGRITRWKLIKA